MMMFADAIGRAMRIAHLLAVRGRHSVLGAAAERNPALARNLAFETRMPRAEAIALLMASPAAPKVDRWHGDRAARNPRLGPGGSFGPAGPQQVAAGWDRAFAGAARGARAAAPHGGTR